MTTHQRITALLRKNNYTPSTQVWNRYDDVRRELTEGYRVSVAKVKGRKIIGIECAAYRNHAEVTRSILELLTSNGINARESKPGSAMIVIEA